MFLDANRRESISLKFNVGLLWIKWSGNFLHPLNFNCNAMINEDFGEKKFIALIIFNEGL